MLSHSSTGMPVVDAQEDFLRARRAHVAARLVRRTRVPRTLPGTAGVPRGEARLEVVPLKAVVGTVEPTNMFDARFRPASEFVRARWARIALAHRRGVSLPPIRLLTFFPTRWRFPSDRTAATDESTRSTSVPRWTGVRAPLATHAHGR
jgi:hypothetical protein